MGAATFLMVVELRRRWRAVAALALLVALVGGVAIASAAGARRSGTSFERFVAASAMPHLLVFTPEGGEAPDVFEPLESMPGVAGVGLVDVFAAFPESALTAESFFPMAASLDGAVYDRMVRPRVLDGRLPDPGDAHEVALGERTARALSVGVGDALPMASLTTADLEGAGDEFPEPTGAAFDLEVVGITRDPLDITSRETDIAITFLTPAFAERYSGEIAVFSHIAMVVLDSAATLAPFTAAVRQANPELEVESFAGLEGGADPVGTTLGVIATSLNVLAAVLAIVVAVAAGQAIARGAGEAMVDDSSLRSLGASRSARLARLAAPGAVVAPIAAVGAGVVAAGLSPLFPMGLAGRAEPEPGFDVDALAVGLGMAGVLAMLLLLAAGSLWLVNRRPARSGLAVRRFETPAFVNRPVLLMGVALRGRGVGGPLGSARLALAVGVAGVVAAVVFGASLDRLLTTQALFGVTWDAGVAPAADLGSSGQAELDAADVAAVAADPAVAEARRGVFQLELDVEGVPVLGVAVEDATGAISLVVATGNAPTNEREVAIGADTLHRIGKGFGDSVLIDGGAGPLDFEIVGEAVLPVSADGGVTTEGVSMVLDGVERVGFRCSESDSCYQQVLVRWVDDADVDAALSRLGGGAVEWIDAPAPGAVQRLTEIENVPWALAGLLAAVAALAIAHALTVAVRLRVRDFGVVRTLGFTGGQMRRAVAVQTAIAIAIGVVVGAVVGTAIGRWAWHTVAAHVGVRTVPVVPIAAVVAAVAAAVVVAQLAAAVPTVRAGRLRPAAILRAE